MATKRFKHTILDQSGNDYIINSSTDLPEYAQIMTDPRVRDALQAVAAEHGLEIMFSHGIEEIEHDLEGIVARQAPERYRARQRSHAPLQAMAAAFVGTGITLAAMLG